MAWVAGCVVQYLKFSTDRQVLQVRDVMYIFLLLVALKVKSATACDGPDLTTLAGGYWLEKTCQE